MKWAVRKFKIMQSSRRDMPHSYNFVELKSNIESLGASNLPNLRISGNASKEFDAIEPL